MDFGAHVKERFCSECLLVLLIDIQRAPIMVRVPRHGELSSYGKNEEADKQEKPER